MIDRSTPPPIHELQPLRLSCLRETRLPSGLRMLFHDNCASDIAYITVIVHGGIAEAPTPATAVLASQLQREGTMSLSGADFAALLDFNGAWIKSSASSHHTVHSLFTLRNRLDDVLPAFAEMVFRPSFPEAETEVRRESLARNIEVSMSDVAYLGRCRSEKMIMGAGHPLAAEDTPATVRQTTSADLRAFHQKYTSPNAATVIVCAATTPEENDRIARTFSSFPATVSAALDIRAFNATDAGTTDIVPTADTSQCSVNITMPAIPRTHPDYLPLHLTVYALGGFFGSRLMLNIREEKGMTYGISSSLLGYIDGAYIDISAETDNAHAFRLIDEVRSELRRLAEDPCRGDEFRRLRQSAMSSQAAVLDSPLSVISHYSTAILSGLPDGYFEAKQRAIESLTSDTVAEMALKYLQPENMRIAIAGNPQ